MEQKNENYLTYDEGRKCLFDGKPIPDQAHATIKFCTKYTLPDGSIHSCKDDYHAEKNRIANLPYQELANYQKRMTASLLQLEKQKGNIVTSEDLDQFDIQLNRAVKTELLETQENKFWFINLALFQINETQFKIVHHDNKF